MCDRKAREIERQSIQNNYQTSDDIRFRMLGRKEERREQTKFGRNDEMGKTRLDHIRNEDIRKDADVKPVETFQQKTKVVWPLLETRTQLHLCEIAKTRGFWEKKQRAEDDRKRDGRTTCRET